MVSSYSIRVYVCCCDDCGRVQQVRSDTALNIKNGAYAVRSIGWSFGRDGKTVICDKCRSDNYR